MSRPLPVSVEAEQAVLGAILMNNDAFELVSGIVHPDDFSEEIHSAFFRAITDMMSAGRVVTPINLIPSFQGVSLGEISAKDYIIRLATEAVSVVNAPDYARTIADLANRRRLIGTGNDLVEAAYVSPIHVRPAELAASAIENLDAVIIESAKTPPRISIGRAAQIVVDRMEAASRGEKADMVSTGLRELDRKLNGGIEPGELVLLAGRPGMGKSALAVSLSLNVSQRDEGVCFYSLEMTAAPLASRALSALCYDKHSPIEYRDMRGGKALSDEKLERLALAQRELAALPFIVEEQGGLTLSQISQRTRRLQGRMKADGRELRLVVIDHLGLVSAQTRYRDSREREVAEISKGMKVLAKELGVAVIALAQLNRQVETRKLEDRRPMLSDLRESGSLEQDADTVIGLFRESYYLESSKSETDVARFYTVQNDIEALLLKSRQGPTGVARLFCAIGSNMVSDPMLHELSAPMFAEEYA